LIIIYVNSSLLIWQARVGLCEQCYMFIMMEEKEGVRVVVVVVGQKHHFFFWSVVVSKLF